MINIKPLNSYSKDIQDVFQLINYKKSNSIIMGSNSMKFKYANDYDLFDVVKTNKNEMKLKKEIVNEFRIMANKIKKDTDIYFISFICGKDADEPKKWSLKELRNKNNDLINYINDVIKLDIMLYNGTYFIPFSNVYEFYNKQKGINKAKITLNDANLLIQDINKYDKKGNIMKCLKRLFVISMNENDEILMNKLINIFESDIGYLYYIKSQFENMIDILELYNNKTTIERVINSIQYFKELLSKQTIYDVTINMYKKFDSTLKNKTSKSIIKIMEYINKILMNKINILLIKRMKKDKISYEKYLLL